MTIPAGESHPHKHHQVLAVIGAGAWGTTLAWLQSANFPRVQLFSAEADSVEEINGSHSNSRYLPGLVLPPNVTATDRLDAAVEGASTVIMAVPSRAFRQVAAGVIAHCDAAARMVLATKGLETGTGLLSLEVFREEAHQGEFGRRRRDPLVISGPNLAVEISRGMPSVSTLAGSDASEVRRAAAALSHQLLTLVPFGDPLGAQAAGALKNVYAIGCGMAAALAWGDNAIAAILWRGLQETGRFARSISGTTAVVATPAGIGDMVATCTSPLSRNHDLGRTLAGGAGSEAVKGVREGAHTALEAARRCRALGLDLPLLDSIRGVLVGERKPEAVLQAACGSGRDAREGDGSRTQAEGCRGIPEAAIKGGWQVAGSD